MDGCSLNAWKDLPLRSSGNEPIEKSTSSNAFWWKTAHRSSRAIFTSPKRSNWTVSNAAKLILLSIGKSLKKIGVTDENGTSTTRLQRTCLNEHGPSSPSGPLWKRTLNGTRV